ncbi:MAG: hypothetical protein QME78_16885 [Thermodesulfobacteriota bacterium]|nr:hypothetical protein [Thermodesulfobacteriota bacterium]
MTKGLNYRKDCGECGRTFLTQDRQVKICPRCVEQIARREEQQKRAKQKQAQRSRPSASAAKPVQPSNQSLTEELKVQILKEFEPFREDKTLLRRAVHSRIAKKLKVKRMLVAQALQGGEREVVLTEEVEKEVVNRYRSYVLKLERPARGRRKTIAREMGIHFRTVALAVWKWNRQQPTLKELTREQRFFIEKSYLLKLKSRKPLGEVVEEIAQEAACPPLQVFRYLDCIHDGQNGLKKVPEASPDQKETILAGYAEYLSGSAPPEILLHTLLAEKAGVNHKQVHKVLLNYRLERLRELQPKAPL